jgi:hypothetical protein
MEGFVLTVWYENAGQDRNTRIKVPNKSFENKANLKYLGTTKQIKIAIHEEIKNKLNYGNICYHSDQDF